MTYPYLLSYLICYIFQDYYIYIIAYLINASTNHSWRICIVWVFGPKMSQYPKFTYYFFPVESSLISLFCLVVFSRNCPSLFQTSKLWYFFYFYTLSGNFDTNINQASSSKVTSLTVICKFYFTYLI